MFDEAVKFTPVTLALDTLTRWETGLKVSVLLLGVTVYEPFAKDDNVKFPLELVVVEALDVPVKETRASAPSELGVIVPLMEYVVGFLVTVKLTPLTFALLMVTDWVVGENVYPLSLGVTT